MVHATGVTRDERNKFGVMVGLSLAALQRHRHRVGMAVKVVAVGGVVSDRNRCPGPCASYAGRERLASKGMLIHKVGMLGV